MKWKFSLNLAKRKALQFHFCHLTAFDTDWQFNRCQIQSMWCNMFQCLTVEFIKNMRKIVRSTNSTQQWMSVGNLNGICDVYILICSEVTVVRPMHYASIHLGEPCKFLFNQIFHKSMQIWCKHSSDISKQYNSDSHYSRQPHTRLRHKCEAHNAINEWHYCILLSAIY